ncbi:MAG: SusC/RagA family TonB-linked outer membrane protein [Ignavibacteria bacterium]
MARFYCLLAVFVFIWGVLRAQGLEIEGKVIAKASQDALPGAIVKVKATTLGTTADVNGRFKLSLPNLTSVTLQISYIGYKTRELAVGTSTKDLVVALEEDVLRTSEVVVTGLASSVKKQNVANSVATISAKELLVAPTQTLDAALSGKFTGVTVSQNSGAPGGGISINLRGVTTINGENQPLFVLDGVIVDNTATQSGVDAVTKATGGGNANFQDNPVNRIADLNPNDIETIEVLKGPSAAAIYGSKASRGVVIITTKSGIPGKTSVDISQQIGLTSISKKLGSRKFTAQTALQVYGQRGLDEFNKGKTFDYEDEMYGQKGLLSETNVGVRGGSQNTQFYISGIARTDQGIIKRTGYEKYGAKVNVTHRLSDNLEVALFTNFFRTSADRGLTNNDNTNTTFGIALTATPSFVDLHPVNGVYPDHPFNASNPLQTRDLMKNNELVNRTINSGRLRWTIFKNEEQNLDFIANGGIDFYSQTNKAFFPRELQFEKASALPGTSILGETTSKNNNLYVNLLHTYVTASNMTFQTAVGVQVENRNLEHTLSVAKNLIVGQENIDQGSSLTVDQNLTIERNRGFFAQEEVNIDDRFFLTAGVRGDASSSNGDTKKYFLFPKVSCSVRLSQFDFWSDWRAFAPEMKLRAAAGATGTLPQPGAKFTTFNPLNISGGGGLIIGTVRGNPNIEPEKSKEIEVGFDATLFHGGATVEFSYYRRTITDLFLFRDLPPSTGFAQEVINGGEMLTRGVEVAVGFTPVRSESFIWTSRINFYKTKSTIEKLSVPAFNTIGFADVLGRYRIEEGKSATQIVGIEPDFAPNGNPITGTQRLRVLGDETPDFQMSFINSLTYGNFDLNFLIDWKKGGKVINLTRLLSDLNGTTPDLDTPGGQYRVSLFGRATSQLVEDGSYVRMREISLGYSFDKEVVQGTPRRHLFVPAPWARRAESLHDLAL